MMRFFFLIMSVKCAQKSNGVSVEQILGFEMIEKVAQICHKQENTLKIHLLKTLEGIRKNKKLRA